MILYFHPGLGADSDLAPLHELPGYDIRWIEWPENIGGSWEEFILELKKENRFEPGSVHIGISFGGLVAQRMATDTEADLFYRMASRLSGKQVRALIGFIPAASRQNPPECPILRLHGRKDRILPFGNQTVDFGIEGGGHLISMTNSNEINGILVKRLAGKP